MRVFIVALLYVYASVAQPPTLSSWTEIVPETGYSIASLQAVNNGVYISLQITGETHKFVYDNFYSDLDTTDVFTDAGPIAMSMGDDYTLGCIDYSHENLWINPNGNYFTNLNTPSSAGTPLMLFVGSVDWIAYIDSEFTLYVRGGGLSSTGQFYAEHLGVTYGAIGADGTLGYTIAGQTYFCSLVMLDGYFPFCEPAGNFGPTSSSMVGLSIFKNTAVICWDNDGHLYWVVNPLNKSGGGTMEYVNIPLPSGYSLVTGSTDYTLQDPRVGNHVVVITASSGYTYQTFIASF